MGGEDGHGMSRYRLVIDSELFAFLLHSGLLVGHARVQPCCLASCIFLNFASYSLFSPGILERGHLMLCSNKDNISVDIWYSRIFMNPHFRDYV